MGKHIIDQNNGMNDLDLEIKKGFHLYAKNEELMREGKKMADDNNNERKDLKGIED